MTFDPVSSKPQAPTSPLNRVSTGGPKPAQAEPKPAAEKPAGDKFAAGVARTQQPPGPQGSFKAPDWSSVTAEKVAENYVRLNYTVAPGDTVESIAARLGTTAQEVRDSNWEASDPSKLTPGQKIMVPGTYRYAKPGDTWASLAGKVRLDPAALAAYNNATGEPNPGDEIRVPGVATSPEDAAGLESVRKILTEAADADGQLLYGPGSMPLRGGGTYNLIWGLGDGESTSYSFSNDLSTVQVADEARDELVALRSPFEGTRDLAMRELLSRVGYLYRDANVAGEPGGELSTMSMHNGGLMIDIPSGDDRSAMLMYDADQHTLSATGFDGKEVSIPAESPMDILKFASALGLKSPAYPPSPEQGQ